MTTLSLADGEIALGVDGNTRNALIDTEDVTRVKVKDGKIRGIGKGLADFNGFDTGILPCSPAMFDVFCRYASHQLIGH